MKKFILELKLAWKRLFNKSKKPKSNIQSSGSGSFKGGIGNISDL